MDDLTRTEYETFRRSPDWELSNVWRALHMMEWLNGPEEHARIAAVAIIRAERRAARRKSV